MAMFSVKANAADGLTLTEVSAIKGKTAVLYVNMSNSESINALAFDLTLPSGVTIARSGDSYSVDFVSARKPSGGTITCGDPSGNTYTIAEFSTSNGTFKGSSGAIITITLNVSNSTSLGDNEIKISNAAIVNSSNQEKSVAEATTTLKVKEVTSTQTIAQLVSVGSARANDIPASGGQSRAEATVEYKYWTRTTYSDGSKEDGSATTKTMTIYGDYVSASDLGSKVVSSTSVGQSTASGTIEGYKDENGNTITATATPINIYQAANNISSYENVNISFADGQSSISVPAGEEFDLSKIISVSQNATFASGAKGTAEVSVYYSVVKSVEGFNPLALTDESAIVSVQPTADLTIAKAFTVRVLALGEGNKVAVADIEFSASQSTSVKSIHTLTNGATYDLNGRIVNLSDNSKGIFIKEGQKIMK